MTLDSYLDATGEDRAEFAARLGKSEPWLSKVIRGSRYPGRLMRGVIERVTDGAVPDSHWKPSEKEIDAYLAQISTRNAENPGPGDEVAA